ncbi:MAG: cell division protein FtsA, partial [Alphaproteobacteria bacterium]
AAGLASLVDDEIELGVTVVDMGGGTTTMAVFRGGHAVHTDWVPVGGTHVTGDIARGLSTPLAHAERMKTLYGSAIASPSDDREIIDVPMIGEETRAEPNHVPRSMLNRIIQPRLEETFEMVRERLNVPEVARLAGRRVILTGGASQLQGVRELAALILEKQVRMGRPRHIDGLPDSAAGPAFSTCAGLLIYAARSQLDARAWANMSASGPLGRLGRLGHWLRESF